MRKKRLITLCILSCIVVISCSVRRSDALTLHLRIAFNEHQAPYHFVDENGESKGMHIDLLKLIADRAGYELEFFPMDTSSDCVEALQNGDIDMVLDITRKFGSSPWVSDPLSEETVCLVQRGDRSSYRDAGQPVVAFQLGIVTPSISTRFNALYSLAMSSQEDAILELLNGNADRLVALKESVLYHFENSGIDEGYSIINNYLGVATFSLLVPENDYALLRSMNQGISEVRSMKEYAEIRDRWSHPDVEYEFPSWVKKAMIALSVVFAGVLIYAISINSFRKTLKIQVEEQTLRLQAANDEIQHHLEQLKIESDMRKKIIQYSYLGMLLFDENYEILLINDSALAMSGSKKNPGDVRRLNVFSDIAAEINKEQLFERKKDTGSGTRIISIDDGTVHQYRYSYQQMIRSGKVWAILLIAEDISFEETRRLADFEEEKSKSLNQIVAGIAHEIKNPLMAIKTFAQASEDAADNPDFIRDFNHYVPAEVDRINRLVEGLISYAKPATDAAQSVDLSELIAEVMFFIKSTYRIGNIRIDSSIEPGHAIIAKRDQIKQVLINIMMNGIESMQEKLDTQDCTDLPLKLFVSLHKDREFSVITVKDDGTGMDDDTIALCMNPFYSTKKTGTGLGLSLSQRFVKENGGQLSISSIPGEYTSIKITFRRAGK